MTTIMKKPKTALSLQQQIEALEAKMLAQKAKLREKQQKLLAKAEAEKTENRNRIGKLAEDAGLLNIADAEFVEAFKQMAQKLPVEKAAAATNSSDVSPAATDVSTTSTSQPTTPDSDSNQTKRGMFGR